MVIQVSESSQIGEARRKAAALAETRLGTARGGDVALATTELATNLVKHGKGGHILVQPLQNGNCGLRIMGVDKGPGIRDFSRALSDGQSTAGSLGGGLGAIRRICDSFEFYSVPDSGTVVSAEFWGGKVESPTRAPILAGVVSEPVRGEDACGDGWGMRTSQNEVTLMVVDGTGHGILASEAAREAERVLSGTKGESLSDIVHDTHAALKKTRGAAFAVARIRPEAGLLSFVGVGNISASILTGNQSRSMVSHHGIVGQHMERVQEFSCPWDRDSILVMHSDGLATRWDLEHYPGIRNKPPSMIAAVLHRDFYRGRDDVTVLAAKAA